MRPSFGHTLTVAFAATVAILLATAAASYRDARQLVSATDLMTRAHEVLSALDRLVGHAMDAESGSRAYVLHGTAAYRAQYERGSHLAEKRLDRLTALVAGDTALTTSMRQLHAATERRIAELARVVAVRDSAGSAAAASALLVADGGAARDGADHIADALIVRQRATLEAHAAEVRRLSERSEIVVRAGILLAAILAPLGVLVVRNDVAARRSAERDLGVSEARFRAAADGSMDAFYVLRAVRDDRGAVSDFEFADLNARAGALLGGSRASLVGQRLCELIPANRDAGFFAKYEEVMESGIALEEEFEVTTPQVHAAWIRHQVVPMPEGVAITSRDVTERRRQDEAMRALSLTDELTGLYNRRGFLTLAQQQLKLARRTHRELLLLFIDMDDFKEINDRFGHGEGDGALRRTAELLRATFRDSDIVGRIGGDEFVVLATDSGATTTAAVMQRLRRALHERNTNDGYPYRLSFSVGAARFDPAAPPSIEELIATADSMLYEQKKHKRQGMPTGR